MTPTDHSALVAHVERIINTPRRDWRFWAALAAFCLCLTSLIGIVNLADGLGQARGEVDDLSGIQACRSRAALVTENAGAVVLIVTGKVVVAAGNREDVVPIVAALKVAAENYELALVERTKANIECEADTSYVIDPALFAEVPEVGN